MAEHEEELDEIIARRVQDGESELFKILVARYEPKLTRYAKRFLFGMDDAKDVVQEVFIKAYVHISKFDTARRFSPWIYRIAHNEFVNAIKKDKRRSSESSLEDDVPDVVAPETADGDLHRGELRKMFYESINLLSPKYREPLVLYYFQELDYKEIGDILEIPVSTVGVRLQRGKAMLKKIIKEKPLQ